MSKHHNTRKGKSYVVTPTVECTVTTQEGITLATCEPGMQTIITAPDDKGVIVSDDNALFTDSFKGAASAGSGGGASSKKLKEHIADTGMHITPEERDLLNSLIHQPALPEGALSWSDINHHFALAAQPGTPADGDIPAVPAATAPPADIFVTRVLLAYQDDNGTWQNTATKINEDTHGVSIKLFDNAGLRHECSTDTVEGVDDYNGKRWAFYAQQCNYVTDERGFKHITAIKGVHDSFDPYTKPVGAFGTKFYRFCKPELSQREDGTWRTHDGTATGHALYQVWGITSRPWGELTDTQRAQLASIGIGESDLRLWRECRCYDEDAGALVERPYWIHSAYCGGAEKLENGNYMITSKRNLPAMNNLSHNALNNLYGYKAGFGGGSCVQAFGTLFDIVKNGEKSSQKLHAGNSSSYQNSPTAAACDTLTPDYVYPVASQGSFVAGCTVAIRQATGDTLSASYKVNTAQQVARIVAIETRELTLLDGTTASHVCLVLDPSTCKPFVTRTTAADAMALSDAGEYAHCYAVQWFALSGETDGVIGRHDGSIRSLTDSKHTYRVQMTEYQPGYCITAADTVLIKGTGSVEVSIGGVTTTPTSSEYVVLVAGLLAPRKSDGTLADFIAGGYVPSGIAPTTAGWILNVELGDEDVVYPTAVGGSDTKGHGDHYYTGVSPAEFLSGGGAYNGSYCGSVFLRADGALSNMYGHTGGRD